MSQRVVCRGSQNRKAQRTEMSGWRILRRLCSTTLKRSRRSLIAVASKLVQPLNELSFSLMARSDRADATIEIILASLFCSQRLKIGKNAHRLVIARWVAAFDSVLNLAPDAGTALLESLQPHAERFFGLRCLAAPFRSTALGAGTPTLFPALLRPHSQCTGRPLCRRRRVFPAKSGPQLLTRIGVPVNATQQRLNLA